MKTIGLTFKIEELEGFNEADMLQVISNNLSEVSAKQVRYKKIDGGYRFEVDFEPQLLGFEHQPILSCFSSLQNEYDKIRIVGIPQDQLSIN